jgi:hypothetical protein
MGDQLLPERSVPLRLTARVNHSGQVCPTLALACRPI